MLRSRSLQQSLRSFSSSSIYSVPAAPTHYEVTLKRSPLHLPADSLAACVSIGLRKRLSTTLIPINQSNSGNLLTIKELISVKLVNLEEFIAARPERSGEGRTGAGLTGRGGNGVIRVGKDRCRGEERGFRVL